MSVLSKARELFGDVGTYDKDDRIYADISFEAYGPEPSRRKMIGDYKYDENHSRKDVAIYSNGSTVIIGFKGTSSPKEVKKDIKLIQGKVPIRYLNRSKEYFDYIKRVLPGKNYILTGHSLGGLKAMWVAKGTGLKGVVFNPFIPEISGSIIDLAMDTPGIKKYTVIGDFLSNNILKLSKDKTNTVLVKVPGLNKHTINNFV